MSNPGESSRGSEEPYVAYLGMSEAEIKEAMKMPDRQPLPSPGLGSRTSAEAARLDALNTLNGTPTHQSHRSLDAGSSRNNIIERLRKDKRGLSYGGGGGGGGGGGSSGSFLGVGFSSMFSRSPSAQALVIGQPTEFRKFGSAGAIELNTMANIPLPAHQEEPGVTHNGEESMEPQTRSVLLDVRPDDRLNNHTSLPVEMPAIFSPLDNAQYDAGVGRDPSVTSGNPFESPVTHVSAVFDGTSRQQDTGLSSSPHDGTQGDKPLVMTKVSILFWSSVALGLAALISISASIATIATYVGTSERVQSGTVAWLAASTLLLLFFGFTTSQLHKYRHISQTVTNYRNNDHQNSLELGNVGVSVRSPSNRSQSRATPEDANAPKEPEHVEHAESHVRVTARRNARSSSITDSQRASRRTGGFFDFNLNSLSAPAPAHLPSDNGSRDDVRVSTIGLARSDSLLVRDGNGNGNDNDNAAAPQESPRQSIAVAAAAEEHRRSTSPASEREDKGKGPATSSSPSSRSVGIPRSQAMPNLSDASTPAQVTESASKSTISSLYGTYGAENNDPDPAAGTPAPASTTQSQAQPVVHNVNAPGTAWECFNSNPNPYYQGPPGGHSGGPPSMPRDSRFGTMTPIDERSERASGSGSARG